MANDPRFASWCEHCDWNVSRPDPLHRPGRVTRLYQRLGRRFGASLAAEVMRRGARRPRLTLAAIAAGSVAVLVFAVVIALAWMGVVVVVASNWSPIGLLFGLFLLGMAWVMRPRLPGLAPEDRRLGRADAPRLFTLLDRVARSLKAGPVDVVVISGEVNAAYGRYGWRRRPVLFLGLPLWLALEDQERVALLGHELAHGVNGDPGRGLLLHGAVTSLIEAHLALEPESLLPGYDEGIQGYLAIPFRIVQLGVSRLILGLALFQILLCYRAGQRAEHYADALAVQLGGTTAMLGLLRKLHATETAVGMTWVGQHADAIGEIVAKLRSLPDREIERIRRVERTVGSAFHAAHPPTFLREEVWSRTPHRRPSLALSASDSAAIDAELERFRAPLGHEIVDEYLAAISS